MNRFTAASRTGLGGGLADLNRGGFAYVGRPCTGVAGGIEALCYALAEPGAEQRA
jgi:hypothetical protein